jgi:predicted small secreted protein
MKVTKVQPVVATPKVVSRLPRKYFGNVDPAVIVHSNKTHRTVSEAFRDAEYACSITKFKSDAQLAYEFFRDMIVGMLICGVPLLMLWALVSSIVGAYK